MTDIKYAWLCASTDPIVDRYANGMAGRKLHAISYSPGERDNDIQGRLSVCGRRAKYGWCSDLFNNKCKRCVKKLESQRIHVDED